MHTFEMCQVLFTILLRRPCDARAPTVSIDIRLDWLSGIGNIIPDKIAKKPHH